MSASITPGATPSPATPGDESAATSASSAQTGFAANGGLVAVICVVLGLASIAIVGTAVFIYYRRKRKRQIASLAARIDAATVEMAANPLYAPAVVASPVPSPAFGPTPSRTPSPVPSLTSSPGPSSRPQSGGSERSRPVLQVITRSGSNASTMSTKVVVEHENDVGPWDTRMPLIRKPQGHPPRRKPSERNHEGRRVVHELIPPKYDPNWRDSGEWAGGHSLETIHSNASSIAQPERELRSYIP